MEEQVKLSNKQRRRFELQLRAQNLAVFKEEERQRRRRREIERRNAKWYDPVLEKRGTRIARNYCGRFLLDGLFLYNFLACVPALAFEAYHKFETGHDCKEQQIESTQYKIYWGLKLFKLIMLI